MDKRTTLAIVLSAALVIGYLAIFGDKQAPVSQNPSPAPQAQTAAPKSAPATAPAAKENASAASSIAPLRVVSNAKVEQLSVKTSFYDAVLTSKGAKFESVKYGARKIELAGVQIHGAKGLLDFNPLFSENEILDGNALQEAVWTTKRISETQIQFSTSIKIKDKPAIIEKTYTFNNKNPYFDLSIRITNEGKDNLYFDNGTIIVSPGDSLGPKMDDTESVYNQISTIFYADGSLEKGSRGGGMFSSETQTHSYSKNEIHWFGMLSRYFTVVMIPQDTKPKMVVWDSRSTGGYRIGAQFAADPLAPKASLERKFKVCLAEKEKDILASIDPAIIPASDVSKWIEPLRNGIMFCLLWINKIFGNFGISIIILSLITKMIFLPLTNKSTESMKRMAQLQPKIVELKAKYKDAPDKLQKATVELYKIHKVNPLGGCLPILIQMPFFIALYSALSTSFGLWHSPFVLWITDLSAPDSLFVVSGFHVRLLPVLWAGSTFLQQKMTPTPSTTGGQQWLMKLMPLFLLYVFWTMPSGLTLYWTIQNTLQICQQLYVNKYKTVEEEVK